MKLQQQTRHFPSITSFEKKLLPQDINLRGGGGGGPKFGAGVEVVLVSACGHHSKALQ